jgi:hypothetical protein
MRTKKHYTVGKKWKIKYTALSEQINNKKYHTVGTKWKTKNTTLSEQNEKQKILHCRNR